MTKMTKARRNESGVAEKTRREDGRNERRRRRSWMRKIWISLGRRILNGNERLPPRYAIITAQAGDA